MYQFTYPDKNVVQSKVIVSHDDYLIWKGMPEETDEQAAAKDLYWKSKTGGHEWFTDKSPYYDSIHTGVLNCNGRHLCNVQPIPDTK